MAGRGARGLAALVLVAAAVAAFFLGRPSEGTSTASESRPGEALSRPAARPPSQADPPPSDGTAPDAADVERSEPEVVAAEAIAAWQQQDVAARADGLTRVATPAYQQAAAGIEPSRVPTSPLATTSLRVEADGQALVDARLDDGTALVALLVQVDDAWLLDDLRPADDLAVAGTP
jgi:hypothetical protein